MLLHTSHGTNTDPHKRCKNSSLHLSSQIFPYLCWRVSLSLSLGEECHFPLPRYTHNHTEPTPSHSTHPHSHVDTAQGTSNARAPRALPVQHRVTCLHVPRCGTSRVCCGCVLLMAAPCFPHVHVPVSHGTTLTCISSHVLQGRQLHARVRTLSSLMCLQR